MVSVFKAQHGRQACSRGSYVVLLELACRQAQQRQQDCAWQPVRQGSDSPATQAPHELQRHAEAARHARTAGGHAAVPV